MPDEMHDPMDARFVLGPRIQLIPQPNQCGGVAVFRFDTRLVLVEQLAYDLQFL
jgi:hypothetical protein